MRYISGHRLSYVKTLVVAMGVSLMGLILLQLVGPAGFGIAKALIKGFVWSLEVLTTCVAVGALLALYRDHLEVNGRMDLFYLSNESRSERALASARPAPGILIRRIWRVAVRGEWLLAGDTVEIRSLDEIRETLDNSGRLDSLPFMPEMAAFCSQRARVFRCVDKIYDYGRSKTLRRMRDVVLLAGLRCNGNAHGGCQASCYLLWKKAWLKPAAGCRSVERPRDDEHEALGHSTPTDGRYTCQYTELAAASSPMTRWDIRQDLRPLLAGNVTLGAFCVALLTRLFNAVQRARGGLGYPNMGFATGRRSGPIAYRFAPGDTVRVLRKEDIAATLNQTGRNRGLWFDRDMVKHCGRRYTVSRKVERIIADATGQMLEMKTACLVLSGVEASGEFLRFCAQHEHPFWREVWLSPETPEGADPGTANPENPVRSAAPYR